MIRRILAVLGVSTGALLAVGLPAAVADQHPTAADCATAAPQTACIVITGSDDYGSALYQAGATVKFTFQITNDGTAAGGVDGLEVHSDMQPDLHSFTLDGAPVTPHDDGYPYVDQEIDLAPGQTSTLTFTASATLRSQTPDDMITRLVSTVDGGSSNDVEVDWPTVDLALRSFDAPTVVYPSNPQHGADLDYMLVNYGSSPTASTVTVPVPTGWSIAWSPYGTSPCTVAAAVLTCSFDSFPVGQSASVDLVATPGPQVPAGARITVTATVHTTGAVDQIPGNDSVSSLVVDKGTTRLATSITPSTTRVVAGHTVTFTITITNRGPVAATNLDIYAEVRTTTKNAVVQIVPTDWPCDDYGINPPGSPYTAGPPYDCLIKNFAVGRSLTIVLTWKAQVVGAHAQLQINLSSQQALAGSIGPFATVLGSPISIVVAGSATTTAGGTGLADTGSGPVAAELGLSALLLLAGGGLTVAGRRRRRHG